MNAGTLTVGAPADVAVLILHKLARSIKKTFIKGENTPFIGWKVKGETQMTFVNGKLVAEGRIKYGTFAYIRRWNSFRRKGFGADASVFGEIVLQQV